jgi:hypothetical protein
MIGRFAAPCHYLVSKPNPFDLVEVRLFEQPTVKKPYVRAGSVRHRRGPCERDVVLYKCGEPLRLEL